MSAGDNRHSLPLEVVRGGNGLQYKNISNMVKSLPGRARYGPGLAIEARPGRRFENEMISVQYAIRTVWHRPKARHAHDTCLIPLMSLSGERCRRGCEQAEIRSPPASKLLFWSRSKAKGSSNSWYTAQQLGVDILGVNKSGIGCPPQRDAPTSVFQTNHPLTSAQSWGFHLHGI